MARPDFGLIIKGPTGLGFGPGAEEGDAAVIAGLLTDIGLEARRTAGAEVAVSPELLPADGAGAGLDRTEMELGRSCLDDVVFKELGLEVGYKVEQLVSEGVVRRLCRMLSLLLLLLASH